MTFVSSSSTYLNSDFLFLVVSFPSLFLFSISLLQFSTFLLHDDERGWVVENVDHR